MISATPIQDDDPDAALMLRVHVDEPDAFAALMRQLHPRVFGRLLHLLHDRQEAEDGAQEVFLRLYRSRKRYTPTARFSTWLFHITQNVARNALRRGRRQHWLRVGLLPDDEGCVPPEASSSSPSDRLERHELIERVRYALAGLLDRQRQALEMHEFQHCSYAEIAAALALTPEATKSLLHRARLQMRAILTLDRAVRRA
jgi:RNA polymerase sigma-70 factor, ECF subfamily